MSTYGRDVAVSGNYAYVVENVGLEVYDLTNLASPSCVGGISTLIHPGAIVVTGPIACIIVDGVIDVIDVSVPANPHQIGEVHTLGKRQ